jgi:hypothetical protein
MRRRPRRRGGVAQWAGCRLDRIGGLWPTGGKILAFAYIKPEAHSRALRLKS